MRLPRFRVRTLMVAVAIVGALLGWITERHVRFRRIAAQHQTWTSTYFRYQGFWGGWRELSWHEEMQRKYERAARYPWLPISPDPPPKPIADPDPKLPVALPPDPGPSPFEPPPPRE